MSITVNLYYTGANGSARMFAQEMEASGIADAIRAERYTAAQGPAADRAFIRE